MRENMWCFILGVLVRVSIPAQTSWPRSKMGRKRFIHLKTPHHSSSPKEVRSGTQAGQEAGADAEAMEGCYLLACSACFLIEPKTTSPEMVPPTRGPPIWSLIEKMPYSWNSWRHFPNWSSFLCDNSSLRQVDTKLASTLRNVYKYCLQFYTQNILSNTFKNSLRTWKFTQLNDGNISCWWQQA
jgi:hypothetical protein